MRTTLLLVTTATLLVSLTELQSQSIVSFKEYTENNEYKDLPSTMARFEVDINSYIDIEFNLANYPKVKFGDAEYLSSKNKVDYVIDFIEYFNSEYQLLLDDLNKLSLELTNDDSVELQKLIASKLSAQGDFILKLDTLVKSVYGEKFILSIYEEAENVPIELFGETLLRLQIDALSKYVKLSRDNLVHDIESNVNNSILNIKVWCMHEGVGKQPAQIHLNNYDNLPIGDLNLINKTAFTRTEEENIRLNEDIVQYNRLAKSVSDLENLNEDIQTVINVLREKLRVDINELIDLISNVDITEAIDGLIAETLTLKETQEIVRLRKKLIELKESFSEIIAFSNNHQELLQEISSPSGSNPLLLFDALENAVSNKKTEIENLKGQLIILFSQEQLEEIRSIILAVETILEKNANQFEASLRGKIIDFINVKSVEWFNTFGEVKVIAQKYDEIISLAISTIKNVATSKTIVEEVVKYKDTFVPTESFTRPYSDTPPTKIEIPRTQRNDNDIYTLYIQIGRNKEVIQTLNYSFRIRTYGVYRKWNAGLNFLMHENDRSFIPTTSVSYILHLRKSPQIVGTSWKKGKGIFGDVINLGLGLNSVVIPDFEDNTNIQFGLGVSLTFFDDILQTGGGVNLQRKSDRGYFFITASLLDLIRRE